MVKKSHSPEQIINKLREAEILLNQGATISEASRKIGVTEQTYYRWRKEYGGMRIEQAKRLWALERENARLKNLRLIYLLTTARAKGMFPAQTSAAFLAGQLQPSLQMLYTDSALGEIDIANTQ